MTNLSKRVIRQKYLLLMALPAIALIFIFNYLPMYGVIIAMKNYKTGVSIMRAEWVGLKWFSTFFRDPYAWRLFRNTVLLGFWSLAWGFPSPILLALLFNELSNPKFKKLTQTISYLPHFVSTVVIVGILKELVSKDGPINALIASLGGEPILFFTKASWFRTLFVVSNIWQSVGWGTIIYLAALAGIDPQLYEAAIIDGATRFDRVRYITLPCLMPTASILFILNVGSIVGADTQKVLLMYSEQTYETSDIIGTYVYREGMKNMRYSYSSAVGLFMSALSFMIAYTTNMVSRRLSDNSLW